MPFEVIPALDVAAGRLVRVDRSGAIPVDAFGADPLTAASAFVREGATRLHLVDVDLARSGEVENLPTLRAVCQLGRDHKLPLLTDLHAEQALLPTLDDLRWGRGELEFDRLILR